MVIKTWFLVSGSSCVGDSNNNYNHITLISSKYNKQSRKM